MDTQDHYRLIEELDLRQNDIIKELDALNVRIENLLHEWTRSSKNDATKEQVEIAS